MESSATLRSFNCKLLLSFWSISRALCIWKLKLIEVSFSFMWSGGEVDLEVLLWRNGITATFHYFSWIFVSRLCFLFFFFFYRLIFLFLLRLSFYHIISERLYLWKHFSGILWKINFMNHEFLCFTFGELCFSKCFLMYFFLDSSILLCCWIYTRSVAKG